MKYFIPSGNMDENGQWNGMVKELVEKVYIT